METYFFGAFFTALPPLSLSLSPILATHESTIHQEAFKYRPFSQALMAALYVMVSVSTRLFAMPLTSCKARTHFPAFSHALMAACT